MLLSGVQCMGLQKNLADCLHDQLGAGAVSCAGLGESITGVVCVREQADLVIDEHEVERSAYLEDRQLLYLQCAMEEHCISASAYALKADPEVQQALGNPTATEPHAMTYALQHTLLSPNDNPYVFSEMRSHFFQNAGFKAPPAQPANDVVMHNGAHGVHHFGIIYE
ncbi:lysyl oxidase homolog 2B-like [Amblyomma americanum]